MGIYDGFFLAADVDETLISEGVAPQKNIQKIDEFVNEGGTFALCSGRSIEALQSVIKQVGKDKIGPSPTFNGGVIYDVANDKVLFEANLATGEKEFTRYVIENMSDIGMEVHTRDTCYVPNRTEYTDLHEKYEYIDARFCSFDEIKELSWVKVIFIPYTEERRNELREAAERFTDGSSVFYDSSATINGDRNLYLEQMPAGVSKGAALKKIRAILSIPDGRLCGIGDYYNDAAMLCEVDVPALTLGAPEDLKPMAEYITCSCTDGAVADFIDYLKEKV